MSGARHSTLLFVVLMLTSVAPGVQGDELGHLFFTDEERVELQQLRELALAPPVVVAEPPDEPLIIEMPEAPALPQNPVTLDGYVQRSRGPSTVWVNGESNIEGHSSAGQLSGPQRGANGLKVRVVPQGSAIAVRLKPGQTFEPVAARTRDLYEVDTPDSGTSSGKP